MYSDFRSFNPEGERLLVLTLAENLSRKESECGEDRPGLLRRIVNGLRPAQSPVTVTPVENNVPCSDVPNALPLAR